MDNPPSPLDTPGDHYSNFVVTQCLTISELGCTLRCLTHLPSGASIMQIANEDTENLFCLSFKTLPTSSNGVAHILEHVVLCGSEKFPVKDPFFAMSRRSLNTFMNALTGSDFTCYPAASQVEKDFYNLLEVYLDAVFHPQIKFLSFLQEGHRLEFLQPQDPKTPLQAKGIVYNEMKGGLTSIDTRLWHAMMQELVPDLPYAFNSGGDPAEILNLSYEELKEFHSTYYHPSHCLFFFYGNLPIKQHLDFIEKRTLQDIQKASPLPAVDLQKRFNAPKHLQLHYPVSETEETSCRSILALGWLTAPLISQDEVLALCLIDAILMETDASLLRKKILESGLCIHVDAYIDTDMSEVPYLLVCKGCDPAHMEDLKKAIFKALKEIVQSPIPFHRVEAALHQLELSRLEIAGDHAPFGLTLFMRSALAKQHGCDPENALMIHSLFDKLLEKIKDPNYLPDLITKHFIDNEHLVRIDMHPDRELSSQELQAEKKHLEKVQKNLTPSDVEKILLQTEQLQAYQVEKEHQSNDCLPKIGLEDVSPLVRDFSLDTFSHGNFEVFHHDCFTNHLIYADLVFDLGYFSDEELPYLHLLMSLIPELGSGARNWSDNLEYIQAHTGGIGAALSLHVQADDPQMARPSVHIRAKGLHRKAKPLFELLRDTLLTPRFDEKKRIHELLMQTRDSLRNRLSKQGMRYAIQLALSGYSCASHTSQAWFGIRYYQTIEKICKNLNDRNLSTLIDKLLDLKKRIFSLHKPHLILSSSSEMLKELQLNDFYGLTHLQSSPFTPWDSKFPLQQVPSQARTIASNVAFCAEGYKTISYVHPFAPALLTATELFDNQILHRAIREQGGAYGCGAGYASSTGHFYFHSYRDPHIARTRESFHRAIDTVAKGDFTDQNLEEAKLGILQHMDAPIAPSSRALTAYTFLRDKKNKQMRQNFRTRLLALTSKDLQRAVEAELLSQKEKGVFVAFAGKELIEKENILMKIVGKELPVFPIL